MKLDCKFRGSAHLMGLVSTVILIFQTHSCCSAAPNSRFEAKEGFVFAVPNNWKQAAAETISRDIAIFQENFPAVEVSTFRYFFHPAGTVFLTNLPALAISLKNETADEDAMIAMAEDSQRAEMVLNKIIQNKGSAANIKIENLTYHKSQKCLLMLSSLSCSECPSIRNLSAIFLTPSGYLTFSFLFHPKDYQDLNPLFEECLNSIEISDRPTVRLRLSHEKASSARLVISLLAVAGIVVTVLTSRNKSNLSPPHK